MHRAALILSELSAIDVRNPRILDLGCGTGWMTAILSQFGVAEGVDLAPEPARQFHPNLIFHRASDAPRGPFDVVVSQEVIEHVDDQSAYVETAYEALRCGGHLILTTPNAAVSLRHPELLIQPVEKHLTQAELRQLLSRRFEVKNIYSFFYGYARWRPYRIQMRFGKALNAGLHLMAVCQRTQ
ncbi:MAG: class I SAM-dependent methyltransferase [Burkholderiaceae bacterium]